MASDEWKVVPDIWRSSAEKYGDNVALVDPYHHPPTTMTYKQVNLFNERHDASFQSVGASLFVIGISHFERSLENKLPSLF